MKTIPSVHNYLRIILVSLIIAFLGLAPHPHVPGKLLKEASQAVAHGDPGIAAIKLANSAEYFPWRYDLNLSAGRYAMQAGDPEATIQYLERPGTISHLSTNDIILLGDAYSQIGDSLMAEAIWKHASEVGASMLANQRLAALYLQRQDYPSAIQALEDLLSEDPSNVSLYYQIGAFYAITEPGKALSFLAQAEAMDSENTTHAQILHDKIRTASLFDEPSYTLLIVGRQLANWGEWDLAAKAFQNSIILRPDYADAWALMGEARQQIEISKTGTNSKSGYYELDHALQLDPASTLANTFMGLYFERLEEFSQAQVFLKQAIASSPEDPFLHAELGSILAKIGDLPAAQAAYESAILLAPQDPLFYRLLAEFAMQHQIQLRELALPAIRQAINLDPSNASSLDVMAQVMLMLQDYHSAKRFAQSALQSEPEFASAYLHLGTAYLYLGESDLAHHWLQLAITVNPDSWISAQAKRMLEYYFP